MSRGIQEKHEYRVDGIRVPRSTTGLLHAFSSEFDPRVALQSMKSGENWPEKRRVLEEGCDASDEAILALWERRGLVARSRGTLLHLHCKAMVNGITVEEPHSPEFIQAQALYERMLNMGLQPFRAEVNLCHFGLKLAGQVDLILRNAAGELVIADWKRAKDIRWENRYANLQYPLDHLPDCTLGASCRVAS